MGNKNSITNKYESNVLPLSEESIKFDKVAANFILSQTSSDIKKITDLEYCNKLVILTSKIIKNESVGGAHEAPNEKNDDAMQPNASDEAKPKETDEAKPKETDEAKPKETVEATPTDAVIKPNISDIPNKEKCDILPDDRAKLYIKVAHLVGAIMTAINPVIYTNDGLVSLFDRHNLASDAEILGIGHYSFCSRRYDSLFKIRESTTNDIINDNICSINNNSENGLRVFYKGIYDDDNSYINDETKSSSIDKEKKEDDTKENGQKEQINDNPKENVEDPKEKVEDPKEKVEDTTDLNITGGENNSHKPDLIEKNNESSTDGDTIIPVSDSSTNIINYKNNMDELGIPELKGLYYDEYDTVSNSFRTMSVKSKQQYTADIKQFYTQFTGKDVMPSDIKSFSDINLRDYNKHPFCLNNKVNHSNINVETSIFTKFASNYKNMASSIFTSHSKLWNIFTQLIDIDETTLENAILNRKDATIKTSTLFSSSGKNDDEKFDKINKLTDSTRTIIVKMYIECEQNFLEGVQILETLLASVNNETTARRMYILDDAISKILSESIV